jgi:predicted nucleotidyltransferase
MKKRLKSTREKIDEIVRRVVRQFHPEKIILFGSHAKGTAGPDSDVDLLIIMPVSGSKREKQIEIGVALHDIRIPMDIIVTTPEEVERRKNLVGTVIRPALREGEIIYVRGR